MPLNNAINSISYLINQERKLVFEFYYFPH